MNRIRGRSAVQCGALFLCSLRAATSQFSVLIGQKMQLTGRDNGNDMRHGRVSLIGLSRGTS